MPEQIIGIFIGLLFVFILLLIAAANIKIVPQATVFVIERLGTYYATWETGLHFKVPFFDRIAKKVSIKEQVVDFKPQPVRYGRFLSDNRRQAFHLRCGAPAFRYRKPDRNHPS